MSCSSSYILFIFLFVLLLPYSALAQGNGIISVGSSITAADKKAKLWYSPSGDFAFGFTKVQDQFVLSIWHDKIPDKTIVWFLNDGTTVPADSKVQLTADRGLVLADSRGKELWRYKEFSGTASNAVFNDTGNFKIVGSDSSTLWDTFSNPTDTLLPTQTLAVNGKLYSRLSATNFTRGKFQLNFGNDGNLVLHTRDIITDNPYDAYYSSGTSDLSPINQGYQVQFNETGYVNILRRNGNISTLTNEGAIPSPAGYYHRAILNYDGYFVQYYHPKNFSTGTSGWTRVWQEPENICAFLEDFGGGVCGYNSVCVRDDSASVNCECPESYLLLDPNYKHGGCIPNFTQLCDHNGSAEDLYDIVELTDTDWPGRSNDYATLKPTSEGDCKRHCLNDCFCTAAFYHGENCWKKKLPMTNGRKDSSVIIGKAFLKIKKGDLSPELGPGKPVYYEKKNKGTLILVGGVLLGSSVFVNFVLIVVGCFGLLNIYKRKISNLQSANGIVETNVRLFTNNELVEATDGFKEELGRGSFGVVYKGLIHMSSTVIIAVKKIDRHRLFHDAAKEFKTEVNAIAQTHHKNLVRLIGFCEEEDHRLLVYEYMVNGTLATFIFGSAKPSWQQRNQIALGIARGLAYLHEECSTQVIHCDIKPQNILLDEFYNARISDFGLAKLLMLNQSKTNTGIRGTKGYVAPEWFRNTPITVKVDVYSFGVLLLEIICCRRNVEDTEFGDKAILTDWVWDCFTDGRLFDLVDNDREDVLSDQEKVERFVMVGIWCIQEEPSIRPTMRKVIQMLEGVVDIPYPPCPSPFSYSST
ncbi:Receptor-like serine/threonine-protein kinase [Heracleum sosnowskyi]|uniref:Receptor-like serine/threonine-protein kinase n=1 Tax=Heracleum sosnowskyi TaxID=360622 RepID=A0AAD8JDV5_9APIA|nr:Receptor-like serine/threonine-protein kinase [Heracleum sosnowskyi]